MMTNPSACPQVPAADGVAAVRRVLLSDQRRRRGARHPAGSEQLRGGRRQPAEGGGAVLCRVAAGADRPAGVL